MLDFRHFPHLVLFLLACIAALLWTVSQNLDEFSIHEMIVFCLYAAGVLFAQGLIIIALDVSLKPAYLRRILPRALAGVFSAFNIYTLILVHNSHFSALPAAGLVGVLTLLSVATALMYMIPAAAFQKFMRVFATIMIVFAVIQIAKAPLRSKATAVMPDGISMPVFRQHPNIYVVTFDTISPEPVIRQNLGLPGVPYDDEVSKAGGRIIPNTFADRIPTKMSLNLFYALDLAYFDALKKKNSLISNESLNPVHEIFRKNGYKIGFLYETSYFGHDKGYLDYYGIAEVDGVCKHIEKPYAMMGYCFAQVQRGINFLSGAKNHEYPELLFERIREIAKSGTPWFTHAHIYKPGHAKNSFDPYSEGDWEEFRKQYAEKSKIATEMLRMLLATIKKNDPDAVLIIFGDHGALTSRTLLNDTKKINPNALSFNPDQLAKDSPLTYEQIVQDRHAVFNAVFPKTFCPAGFRQNPYSTVRIMRDVIKCLSGGVDPLPETLQPDDDQWKPYLYQ